MNCLEKENLNKFLAGETDEPERAAVETHLAGCAVCRRNLADLSTAAFFFRAPAELKQRAKDLPPKKQRAAFFGSFLMRPKVFAPAGLVVIFCLAGFWFWNAERIDDREETFRQGETSNENAPQLLSPQSDAVVANAEIIFRWQPSAGADSYVLTVSDEQGDIIFEQRTTETNLPVRMPATVSGGTYFWYVRARFPDGKMAETKPRKFSFKN